MADFISFSEGRAKLFNAGLPSTLSFDLSSKDCNTHVVGDTFSGGYGVITGTGYAAQTEAEPTATTANPSVVAFAQKTWATGAATDWPASVKSVVMRDASTIYCAWNLVTGGTARALNAASTTENFTPTLNLA